MTKSQNSQNNKATAEEAAFLRDVGMPRGEFEKIVALVNHVWGNQDLSGMSLDQIMAPLEAAGLVECTLLSRACKGEGDDE